MKPERRAVHIALTKYDLAVEPTAALVAALLGAVGQMVANDTGHRVVVAVDGFGIVRMPLHVGRRNT
jgi:hypothetical protein